MWMSHRGTEFQFVRCPCPWLDQQCFQYYSMATWQPSLSWQGTPRSLWSTVFCESAKSSFVISMLLWWQMPPTPFLSWAPEITAVLYHKHSVVTSLLCLIIHVSPATELNCLEILWDFSPNNTHDHIDANPYQVSLWFPYSFTYGWHYIPSSQELDKMDQSNQEARAVYVRRDSHT